MFMFSSINTASNEFVRKLLFVDVVRCVHCTWFTVFPNVWKFYVSTSIKQTGLQCQRSFIYHVNKSTCNVCVCGSIENSVKSKELQQMNWIKYQNTTHTFIIGSGLRIKTVARKKLKSISLIRDNSSHTTNDPSQWLLSNKNWPRYRPDASFATSFNGIGCAEKWNRKRYTESEKKCNASNVQLINEMNRNTITLSMSFNTFK